MAFVAWRTWVAGAVVTAAQMNQDVRDNLNAWFPLAATSGVVWTSYTTTWSGTLGNGTKTAAYNKVGRRVNFRIRVVWGTTTSHAAASQSFTLPEAAHSDYVNAGIGSGGVAIGGTNYSAMPWFTSSTALFVKDTATANFWTNVLPGTWTTGNVALLLGSYESAA